MADQQAKTPSTWWTPSLWVKRLLGIEAPQEAPVEKVERLLGPDAPADARAKALQQFEDDLASLDINNNGRFDAAEIIAEYKLVKNADGQITQAMAEAAPPPGLVPASLQGVLKADEPIMTSDEVREALTKGRLDLSADEIKTAIAKIFPEDIADVQLSDALEASRLYTAKPTLNPGQLLVMKRGGTRL